MFTKNTLTLLFSAIIVAGFLVFGVLDILDYLIVKVLLFSSFAFLGGYLIFIVLKDADTN